ncbi:MAG: SUMF1/EgtB/PvdO family nonheme iron enzyme [Alphaproteobacteria bacterium]|nr:SUMF1/EgtB/PvdO family nonheme iron enzyme [Alphaproteobacteria bacterium]
MNREMLLRTLESVLGDTPSAAQLSEAARLLQSPLALSAAASDERYEDRGPLGAGGMGELRLVWDRRLGRTLVRKTLKTSPHPVAMARFRAEAELTARLEHPAIVPVHDFGFLPDGRPFFVMQRIQGPTFAEEIARLHASGDVGAGLPRLLRLFHQACDAVAFAHGRGVLHRDLKPSNLMVGADGQARVVDWGLARLANAAQDEAGAGGSDGGARLTRAGRVVGTPAYMAPEQLDVAFRPSPGVDVYGLGAVLYTILCGQAPYDAATVAGTLAALRSGPPPAPSTRARCAVPAALEAICLGAMARDPVQRTSDARSVADALASWLAELERSAQARALADEAQAAKDRAERLRAQARSRRASAREQSATVPTWAPLDQKRPVWRLEDEAAELEVEADDAETRAGQLARAALLRGDVDEAHQVLADVAHTRFSEAQSRGDPREMRRWEEEVKEHDRGRYSAWRRDTGGLRLDAVPSGVGVRARRLEPLDRRLVAGEARALGQTPLEVELPAGSWVLELSAPGRHPVRYPVQLERGGVWAPIRPGDATLTPVVLPLEGAVAEGDCVVPGGWAWLGAPTDRFGLPRRRIWVDAFRMRRFPVTNAEYLCFINDLVARGQPARAAAHLPAQAPTEREAAPVPLWHPGPDGRYALPEADPQGDRWDPDWPVTSVCWHDARAFAAWEAARTGVPWRLPWEFEWEKAARGVDGRAYPWGDHDEPTWFCNRAARPTPMLARVQDFPADESVYGVRGLAGNVRDWCLDERSYHVGPPVSEAGLFLRPAEAPPGDEETWQLTRGGIWSGGQNYGRAGNRLSAPRGFRASVIGFRLACDGPA